MVSNQLAVAYPALLAQLLPEHGERQTAEVANVNVVRAVVFLNKTKTTIAYNQLL